MITEEFKLYAVPYNHGTLLYKDKDCTRLYANDPWHRHRTDKMAIYGGFWWKIIVLNIKKDVNEEMEKFRKSR